MLQQLTISNFAIIDNAHIQFDDGLIVISGETGAGKSILVGALTLLLGGKTPAGIIRTGCDSATVEALFDISNNEIIEKRLEEAGIDVEQDGSLIIKRKFTAKGKNRCYVNDQLVTLSTLQKLMRGLVSIQGQHQQQMLRDRETHLKLIDSFGRTSESVEEVKAAHRTFHELHRNLSSIRRRIREFERNKDIHRFQLKEIEDAELVDDEEEELVREERLLASSQRYLQLLSEIYHLLYESDEAIIGRMSALSNHWTELCEIDPDLEKVYQKYQNVIYQLEDVAEDTRSFRDCVDTDPQRLEWVVNRLDTIRRLKLKYGDSIAEVLEYAERIKTQQFDVDDLLIQAGELENKIELTSSELVKKVQHLSRKREAAAEKLAPLLEKSLQDLGMPSAEFHIDIFPICEMELPLPAPLPFPETGIDHVEYLISPNIGEELKPLADIASGGELSRIMLAFRALIADLDATQTLILDEIDVGIGGEIALSVGQKIKEVARNKQVICITHLPHIAAMATQHLRVSKEEKKGRTYSHITPINDDDRIEEIARMLDGKASSETSLMHARNLLEGNHG